MEMFETALGRLVPANEIQTILEDAVLRLLYDYRFNPQNPNDAPMTLSDIAHAVSGAPRLVEAALDALTEETPPLVKERWAPDPLANASLLPSSLLPTPTTLSPERSFSITGTGVRFVRNMPQGLASAL